MKQGIFLQQMAAGATEAVIRIVGVIGWDIWTERLDAMLDQIPESVQRIIFQIYSPGGSVWDGNAMIFRIGSLPQETVAEIQVAASMAALIGLACDKRRMAMNGRYLVHNPWTDTAGDAAHLEKRAKELRDTEAEASEFIAKRTGRTAAEMLELMAEERWVRAPEAKVLGFVHDVVDPFDESAYKEIRQELQAAGDWPQALADMGESDEAGSTDGTQDGQTGGTDDAGGDGSATDDGQTGAGDPPETAEELLARLEGLKQEAYQAGLDAGKVKADEAYQEGMDAGRAEVRKDLVELQGRYDQLEQDLQAAGKATAKAQADAEAADKRAQDSASELEGTIAARDHLDRMYKQSQEELSALTRRLAKLTSGLRREANDDDAPPETWAEAKAQLGYADARKQYPELYEAYMNKRG